MQFLWWYIVAQAPFISTLPKDMNLTIHLPEPTKAMKDHMFYILVCARNTYRGMIFHVLKILFQVP